LPPLRKPAIGDLDLRTVIEQGSRAQQQRWL